MYIINVNQDSVIKQICQFRGNAYLINETLPNAKLSDTVVHAGLSCWFVT